MQKLKRIYILLLSVILILGCSFSSYADLRDLMIATDSNALMTLELDDSDYAVMPMSSVGTVSNTIQDSELTIYFVLSDSSGNAVGGTTKAYKHSDGRYHFRFSAPDGMYVQYWSVLLYSNQQPSPGTYYLSYDLSSDFSFDLGYFYVYWDKVFKNSNVISGDIHPSYQFSSGDIYLPPYKVNVNNVYSISFVHDPANTDIYDIGGSFAINFTKTESDSSAPVIGSVTSNTDYQSDVSSSLSDLSSSVDEVSDEIGFVAEAIQNLQGAMEPHYNNVLTQLHHITEQLHAFYDQIYNNIHLKEYALWQDIKTAIENIDLEVNVNLDKLKTSIDNMSQAVQNKLQSVGDTITNGFDNSSIQNENNELSGAVDELDQAEKEVLDDVSGYINDFEYPSFDSISTGIIGALSFFGGFLHSMFLSMGSFGLIITFSLTMIFVLIIVGYHRIRS